MPTMTCSACGADLDAVPVGACPSCGGTRRDANATLQPVSAAGAVGQLSACFERVREYRVRHPRWFLVNLILVFGSPLLTFTMVGLPGFLVGEVLAVIGYMVGPRASHTVRRVETNRP